MKRALALIGVLTLFGVSPAPAQSADKLATAESTTLKITGMACGACAARVEKAAKKIDGVTGAKVSQPKGLAEISYDPTKATPQAIAKTIADKTGFRAEVSPKPKS